jgi:hypothetical protein
MRTKKISLNELRSLVKQIIKEDEIFLDNDTDLQNLGLLIDKTFNNINNELKRLVSEISNKIYVPDYEDDDIYVVEDTVDKIFSDKKYHSLEDIKRLIIRKTDLKHKN